MDRESIAQAMGAHVVDLAALTINYLCQLGSLSAVSHNLPTSVTIDTENQPLLVSNHWPAPRDVFLEQLQAITIYGQRSLSAM